MCLFGEYGSCCGLHVSTIHWHIRRGFRLAFWPLPSSLVIFVSFFLFCFLFLCFYFFIFTFFIFIFIFCFFCFSCLYFFFSLHDNISDLISNQRYFLCPVSYLPWFASRIIVCLMVIFNSGIVYLLSIRCCNNLITLQRHSGDKESMLLFYVPINL